MGHRLSKIYTRTGDDGTTGLGTGGRVAKDSPRVEAYGVVDELNSLIGLMLASDDLPTEIGDSLTRIQHQLFDLGGELSMPETHVITAAAVDGLEQTLDEFNADPATAEGLRPAGRHPRGRSLSHRPDRMPARRTTAVCAGA